MKYFVIDAFTDEIFKGNPAAVCFTEKLLDEELMQKIAFENNLSETAFLTKRDDEYFLRWFTPETEIDLCGHATLATAYALMNFMDTSLNSVNFNSKSGILTVEKKGDLYVLDFPSRSPVKCPKPDLLEKALGVKVNETYISRDLLAVVENEEVLKNISPNFDLLSKLQDSFAVIVTAKGDTYDFVSRFFIANSSILEDPVTGSAHCTLIPFWSERLNKKDMTAQQLSRRGGNLYCSDMGERVKIGGKAVCYASGEILI